MLYDFDVDLLKIILRTHVDDLSVCIIYIYIYIDTN